MPIDYKKGYCTLCRSRCGTINHVEDNRLIKITPDPDHPTGAAICMKGRAAPELIYNPNRILYPQRRTTAKTASDPKWERISWQEAIQTISSKLAKIKNESGAEAVAFGVTTPSGTPISDSIDWIEHFIHSYGSPNICYGTEVCNWHKDFAHSFTFGCGMPMADYENADLIMLWGHNPTNTWLSQANAIGLGQKKGAKTLIIDPRKTPLAANADVWLQVTPGTDDVVAMGLINQILEHKFFDSDFIRCWTNSPFLIRNDTKELLRARDCVALDVKDSEYFVIWDQDENQLTTYNPKATISKTQGASFALSGQYTIQLKDGRYITCSPVFEILKQACKGYLPETVEKISGIKAKELQQAALLLSNSKAIAYHAWTGIAQQKNATQTERAIAILYALLGSFDKQGGNRQYLQLPLNKIDSKTLLSLDQKNKALGLKERPLGPASQGWVSSRHVYKAITEAKPYKIRGLFAFGSNPLLSQGDVELGIEALKQVEFHVHCDLFETPSSRYADILLPINTPWEREALKAGFEINEQAVSHVQLRQQMIPSLGESKSDTEIVFLLAKALKLKNEVFSSDLETAWNKMLQPLKLNVKKLRKHPEGIAYSLPQQTQTYRQLKQGKVKGFATPTKRVEIYSETLLKAGYSPLPQAITHNHDNNYPYTLTSVKSGYFCHSQHRSITSLRKRSPLPMAYVNEELAKSNSIAEGDWVTIQTPHGKANFYCSILPTLASKVVVAEFGWWQGCEALGLDSYPITGPLNSNYNQLISAQEADEISGSVPMRGCSCKINISEKQNIEKRAWKDAIAFVVKQKTLIASDAMELELTPQIPRLLPDYLPGQHITVCLNQDRDNELTRAYSLTDASYKEDRNSYKIVVRYQRSYDQKGNLYEGAASSYIHNQLSVGEIIHVSAPNGKFTIPTAISTPIVIFAAGIGITPFISLIESINGLDLMPNIWLFYGNKNSHTHAFKKRLNDLAKKLPKLHIFNSYNEPLASDIKGKDYDTTELLSAKVIPDTLIKQQARFYLCGPTSMMENITQQLITRAVPHFNIFSEIFKPQTMVKIKDNQEFNVEFIRSKEHLIWTSTSGTLLEFAEKNNIKMPSGCRVGQCESCAINIISGNVIHLNGKEPEENNICLTCQAIPISNLVLDA